METVRHAVQGAGSPRPLHVAGATRSRTVVAGLLVAVLAAALTMLLPARAHAYPEPQIGCELSGQVLKPHQQLTITCSAGEPLNWTVSFNAHVKKHTGKLVRESFSAPDVETATVFQARVSGTFADPALGTGSVERVYDVTVSPGAQAAAAQPDSVLPSTGGPQLGLLALAALLVVVGLASVRRARRARR